jgi:pilus assembly protein CpaB
MRNYIILAVSILTGLAAFWLHHQQLSAKYRALGLAGERARVCVLKHDLYQGDVIHVKDLSRRFMLKKDLSGQEVLLSDVGLIVGRKLAVNLKANVPIRLGDIEIPEDGFGSALARRVRYEHRAVSIAVDSTSSVSGLVQPNDHVDLVGTFRFPAEQGNGSLDTVTLTLLQNVTVLATGQQLATGEVQVRRQQRSGRSYATVTLSLTPEEAELVIFAEQKGRLTMTLRHPEDVYTVDRPQQVNFDYLRRIIGEINRDRLQRNEQD